MRILILSLIALLAYAANAQSNALQSWLNRQNKFITAEVVVSQTKLCRTGDIKLTGEIRLHNVSDRTLVFCSECFTDVEVYASLSTAKLLEERFVYDLRSFTGGVKFAVKTYLPDSPPFVSLNPGSTITIPTAIRFERDAWARRPSNRTYAFVVGYQTWDEYSGLAERLKLEWKDRDVELWTRGVITMPTTFSTASKAEKCH